MADDISRKRLKKKVLDRWENEGGRLYDEKTETTESSMQRGREIKTPLLSNDNATDRNDNSAV